jgi:hypothetical protein
VKTSKKTLPGAGSWQQFGAVFHRLGGGTSWNGHSKIGLVFSIISGYFTGLSSFGSNCQQQSARISRKK